MKITTKVRKTYRIEMTETQANDLLTLVLTNADGHITELAVQANHGKERADSVHETINDLRIALQNR